MPETGSTAERRVKASRRRSQSSPRPLSSTRHAANVESVHGDAFFRQLVGSLRNGVLAVRQDGTIAVLNGEACRLFNVESGQADVLGRPAADVLRHHADVLRLLANAFELDHLPNRAELRLQATGKAIGYTVSRIADESGATTGAALYFKDLTRVEQLEERERLRDRLAALGEMAAAIAHEVKNPLAGIEVLAGLLRRQIPDQVEAQSILSEIITEAKMANAIVLEVLDFVRPIRLQMERTAVKDVVRNSVTMADSHATRGEIAVKLTIPEELPAIHGDRHQLCQVFTNLLINAYEALDGKGSVSIAVEASSIDGDHSQAGWPQAIPVIVAVVEDDGPGVTPELTERIFSPFFTTKPQGTGLGLAIVRKIVDAHDGRIDVTSSPGKGARFQLTLPVSQQTDWFV